MTATDARVETSLPPRARSRASPDTRAVVDGVNAVPVTRRARVRRQPLSDHAVQAASTETVSVMMTLAR